MDLLVEPIISVMKETYEKSRVLVTFQGELAKIPEWNKYQISESYNRLKCSYFQSLVRATIATCIRANLLASGTDVSKVKVKVVSAEDFYHRCLITSARSFWKRPHLFYHNMKPIEQQYNLSIVDGMVRKAIQAAIRSCIPYDEILTVIDSTSSTPSVPPTGSDTEEEDDDTLEDESETEEESDTEDEESENEVSDVEVTRTMTGLDLNTIPEGSDSDTEAETINETGSGSDSDSGSGSGSGSDHDNETDIIIDLVGSNVGDTVQAEDANAAVNTVVQSEDTYAEINTTVQVADTRVQTEDASVQVEDLNVQAAGTSIVAEDPSVQAEEQSSGSEDETVTLVRMGHTETETDKYTSEAAHETNTDVSSRKTITVTDFPVKKIHKPSLSKQKAKNAFF